MGLSLCERFDPDFNVDKVVFMGSEFMKAVKTFNRGSWVLFDEPNLELGHRDFMSLINKTVAKFAQASRFLGISACFALPSADFMDTAVVRVANARIQVVDRGWGKIELIKHSQYEGGPRIRYPRLCNIHVSKPSRNLALAYEAKRGLFHEGYFNEESLAAEERKQVLAIKPKPSDDERIRFIMDNPKLFTNPSSKKGFSTAMIAGHFNIGNSKASNLKARADFSFSLENQSVNQS